MAQTSVIVPDSTCPLCLSAGGEVLWRAEHWRVVRVGDADYPGFCRVIWDAHVAEMTDLAPADRNELMDAVFIVESVLRDCLRPRKVNLASLGNQVPHLHWHVVPRFEDDAHFPDAVWAARRRQARAVDIDVAALRRTLADRFRAQDIREV